MSVPLYVQVGGLILHLRRDEVNHTNKIPLCAIAAVPTKNSAASRRNRQWVLLNLLNHFLCNDVQRNGMHWPQVTNTFSHPRRQKRKICSLIRKDYPVPKQFRLDSNDLVVKSLADSGDIGGASSITI